MSNGRIVSVTDLDSLAGHYGVIFNALGGGHYGDFMTGHMVQILSADWVIQRKQ